ALDQRLGLGHVGRLAWGQDQPHRQSRAVDADVDLGAEAAAAAAQGLLRLAPGAVRFFSAPAAPGWARITVESRISHSRSGSWRASKTRCQTPLRAQRSKRRQTEFQLPKRSGRSRQGAPVLAIQKTASTNRRLSLAAFPWRPGRPGSRSWIRSQSASAMAW